MKRLAGLIALGLALIGPPALAATPVGAWKGAVSLGPQSQDVVIRIEERTPGRPTCFASLAALAAQDLGCTDLSIEGARVRFALPAIGGRFDGMLGADDQAIAGNWSAGPQPTPLRLARISAQEAQADGSTHTVRLVTAEDGVMLEVLDYGGEGVPILLIPGYGATGHVFDALAGRLRDRHHVYAMTRRGAGYSDYPPVNDATFAARRLGDDVVAVMDALKLDRPVLAGWSLAGEEMSSVASRRPERVAALVYLDAAYDYAFYLPGNGVRADVTPNTAANDLRARIRSIYEPGVAPAQAAATIDDILSKDLPDLRADLLAAQAKLRQTPAPTPAYAAQAASPMMRLIRTVLDNGEKFGPIQAPILAIFAVDLPVPPVTDASALAEVALLNAVKPDYIARFKATHPSARVVELKGAAHAVFMSNQDDVVREMESFLSGLGGR